MGKVEWINLRSYLVLTAGSDWVVKNSATRRFFDRLSSPDKKLVHLPGFAHAIFHETERATAIAETRGFLDEVFERSQPRPSLLAADRDGYTKREYEALTRPLPVTSLKRWWFAAHRLQLHTSGRLSRGIRIGWKHGFDSGASLDHMYRNHAEGITPLGRMIDRAYLNAVGWRGIRARKELLKDLLRHAIERTAAQGRPVHVVDIASGPGRYLLETLRSLQSSLPAARVTAMLRDHNAAALEEGRRLAADMSLANVTYASGDAFDYNSLRSLNPRPDVAVVSGLYELFAHNAPVLASLRGLAEALGGKGFLVYTNQPWHPQVEYIARVLRNRDGRRWVMRRRTQEEMDQLTSAAGFQKLDMMIDPSGIFTVSLAQAEPAARQAGAAGDRR